MFAIDAHIHVLGDHGDFLAVLENLDLKLVNVCVGLDSEGKWRGMADGFSALARRLPERYAWITAFNAPDLADPNYAERAIEQIRADFTAGAVACKVWKNFGMQLRRPDGSFIMIDDELLEPIFAWLERAGRPAMIHQADPQAAWEPLNPDEPHYGYFSRHPEWHMHGKSEQPSRSDIFNAWDRVLDRHPSLVMIGAHLASREHHVTDLARLLDRHPNLMVDTSARLANLALQNRATVRRFFLDYQDRILFGSDIVVFDSMVGMTSQHREEVCRGVGEHYRAAFGFYGSDRSLTIAGRPTTGLALPDEVLVKFYRDNARRLLGV